MIWFFSSRLNGGSRPSYGSIKGGSNNGKSNNGGGSVPSTYGMANGSSSPSTSSSPSPPLSPASTVAARKNGGFKPQQQYQPSYGTKI